MSFQKLDIQDHFTDGELKYREVKQFALGYTAKKT